MFPSGAAPAAAEIVLGMVALSGATVGMLSRAEPFATWYYLFAWYSTLLIMDGWLALARGRPSEAVPFTDPQETGPVSARPRPGSGPGSLVLGRPGHVATLLGWSTVLWLFFELLNLRLRNWYYVFVPDAAPARWAGITLSFATVLPAIFLAQAGLERLGLAYGARAPAVRVTPRLLAGLRIAGAAMLALPLIWPRTFFPLVWVALTPLLEPSNYKRDPRRSLLGDLERGRPGRLLRLLAAGALVGLLWELYNIHARGKWIYTVPGLEELKLFEMPLLGFLGFPPFALECFAVWQALVLSGLAVPRTGPAHPAPATRRVGAAALALLFCALVLRGMEERTISSYSPRIEQLAGVPGRALRRAGYDVFALASARPGDVARAVGADPAQARSWVEAARLAAFRGIGTRNAVRLRAVGVGTVEELAGADPEVLARELRAITGEEVVPARVREWVRAARESLS